MDTHAATSRSTGGRGSSSGGSGSRGRTAAAAAAATLADSEVRRTGAEVALDGEDLVVVGAELHAEARPRVEMIGHCDGAGRTLALADGPELLEGRGAFDGRSVGALVGVDIVDAAVSRDGSLLGCPRGRVVGAEVFDHIVFDQRVPL